MRMALGNNQGLGQGSGCDFLEREQTLAPVWRDCGAAPKDTPTQGHACITGSGVVRRVDLLDAHLQQGQRFRAGAGLTACFCLAGFGLALGIGTPYHQASSQPFLCFILIQGLPVLPRLASSPPVSAS